MLTAGTKITLLLTPKGIFISDGVLISVENISLSLEHRHYSLATINLWVNVEVVQFQDSVLECEIITCSKSCPQLSYDEKVPKGFVRHIVFLESGLSHFEEFCSDLQKRCEAANRSDRMQQNRYHTQNRSGFDTVLDSPTDTPPSQSPDLPQLTERPIKEHRKEYRFDLDDMQIIDGAALFKGWFDIPYFRRVDFDILVKNDFLTCELDSIKPYIAKMIGRKTLVVTAVIKTKGPEVDSVHATSLQVEQITSELIEQVRYGKIRRELRAVEQKKDLVTVNDLFKDEGFESSGLKPTDKDFVEAILAIKKPKHGDHLQELSELHDHIRMRLRMLKKPFAFLFLIQGRQDSFMVLETLNSKEATYLWKLDAPPSQLDESRDLLRQKFEWVEQEISIISAEGREVYKANKPKGFARVRHDYKSENGFETWKLRLHQVLAGDSECYGNF